MKDLDYEITLSMNKFPWIHVVKALNKSRRKFELEEVFDMYLRQIKDFQVGLALYKF